MLYTVDISLNISQGYIHKYGNLKRNINNGYAKIYDYFNRKDYP